MRQRLTNRLPRLLLAALLLAIATTVGCSSEGSESDETNGGESPARRAKSRIDKAHSDFKESVRPAAEKVDDKTQEIVDEGKRAAEKVADEVSD